MDSGLDKTVSHFDSKNNDRFWYTRVEDFRQLNYLFYYFLYSIIFLNYSYKIFHVNIEENFTFFYGIIQVIR